MRVGPVADNLDAIAQAQLCLRDYRPGEVMAPHQHLDPLLSIVVRGDFREELGTITRSYAAGHAALFPAEISHSQHFGLRGARQVIFRPKPTWIEYLADNRVPIARAPHTSSPRLHQLARRLGDELRTDDSLTALAAEGLMLEIIAAFGRDGATAFPAPRLPAWLRLVRDYLHEQTPSPVSLAQVAAVAGRHEVHVAREFRRFFGVSIGGYVRRRRLERSADLLRGRELSISEIALECGFSSHAHLCRTFRAHYGESPSTYRREA